jgi:hypothetical protein
MDFSVGEIVDFYLCDFNGGVVGSNCYLRLGGIGKYPWKRIAMRLCNASPNRFLYMI